MQSDYLFFEGIVRERSPRPQSREIPSGPKQGFIQDIPAGKFLNSLFRITEMPVSAYRSRSLARRMPACLRFLRASDPQHASLKISDNPQLAAAALNIVLVGVTDFFRDAPVFEYLRQEALPLLLQQEGGLRIWSAACSEGQELYSIAMMLSEIRRLHDCELLGTDCRTEAINRARSGVFAREALEGMEGARENYFTTSGTCAVIDPALQAKTRWEVADLLGGVEAGPWHLILWRNMAIYLEPEAANAVWQQLCDVLEPGGFIVGGRADHPPRWLPLRRVGPCTFQKDVLVDHRS